MACMIMLNFRSNLLGSRLMSAFRIVRLSTLLVIGGLAAGCSTPSWTSPAGTETYQIGYKEGCDSGYAIAGSPMYERIDEASPPFDNAQYVQPSLHIQRRRLGLEYWSSDGNVVDV